MSKDNVIHIPTPANIKHAFEEGRQEGEAAAKAMLAERITPQQLLQICRDATKHVMKPPVQEMLHRTLDLLAEHFCGSDPSAYYADQKKIAGCAFVLNVHIALSEQEKSGV